MQSTKKKNEIRDSALHKITAEISDAGYYAPATDGLDLRSVQAWDILKETELPIFVRYESEFNYTRMASLQHSWISYFQPRDNTKIQQRIDDNIAKFYGDSAEQLLRLPIVFTRHEVALSPFGNGRAYTFKYKEDVRPAVVVDCNKLTEIEFKDLGFQIATVSNRKNEHSTDEEKSEDFVQQLVTLKTLEIEKDPKKTKWTNEQWKKSFEIYLQGIYDMKGKNRKRCRSKIINMALKDGRENSLPFPSTSEIETTYQKYYPDCSWNPEDRAGLFQIEYSTCFSGLRAVIEIMWLNSDKPDAARKPTWLALRSGSSQAVSVTSSLRVSSDRKKTLEDLRTKYNNSEHMKFAGKPKIERVLFVKQLDTKEDVEEMWEWDIQKENFFLKAPYEGETNE